MKCIYTSEVDSYLSIFIGNFRDDPKPFQKKLRWMIEDENGAVSIEYIGIAVAAIVFTAFFDTFWQGAVSTAATALSFF